MDKSDSLNQANTTDADVFAFDSFAGHRGLGKTLLDHLCERFTYFDRKSWTERIQAGEVLLNRRESSVDTVLKMNDEVRYLARRNPEPWVPKSIATVFEDADLLVVNKPAHLPVHPTGRYLRHTLINLLKAQRKTESLFLAHRIDRETSGLVVLTKSPLAKEKMYWQFFKGEVEKSYWALVWGKPSPPSGTIDVPIGLPRGIEDSSIRIKQIARGKDAKSARTRYHTLSSKRILNPDWSPPPWPRAKTLLNNEEYWEISLVECRPLSGRTNQIRVHMAELGAGLVGDKLYDPEEWVFHAFVDAGRSLPQASGPILPEALQKRLVLDAHALHAKGLRLRHPRSGQWLELSAPTPSSWAGLL